MRVMLALLRFDGRILDRVFQPAADWLAGWCSCYQIAAFLLTGNVLITVAYIVWLQLYVLLLFVLFLLPPVVRAYHLITHPPSGDLLPHDRYIWWGYRLQAVLNIMPDLILGTDGIFVAQLLLYIGTAFLSCRPRPPRRKEASLWRWRWKPA